MLGPCGSCLYCTAAWPWFRERWTTAYSAGGKQALLDVLVVGTGWSRIDEDARVEDAVWIEPLLDRSDRFGKQFRSLNVVGARPVHSSNSVMVGGRASG